MRAFYERQNELIDLCLDSMNQSEAARHAREARLKREDLKVRIASYGSLAANIILFCLQLYTAISSKSLSLFATMADSFMDLLSSATLVYAGWVTRNRADKSYKYPVGKRRTLGVGIVIFSTLMVGLSIELLIESIRGLTSKTHESNVSAGNIACISIALCVKLGMLMYCWLLRHHPEARIFATDHLNDLILNAFGLLMALLGTHVVWYIDPIGGLIVGLFIMHSWASEAVDQARLLIGTTADTQFLNQLTYMAMVHDDRVQYVDTVRAYHIGEEKYVEIDIVMDENTPLYESHDVGEALQILVEKQEGVQRAHVHIDFDFQHPPEHHPKSQ
ncbi:cation efflux protein [Martensiomyces pterosporus]|nr:cation efflux protein [Martensiomyces pterosporus]